MNWEDESEGHSGMNPEGQAEAFLFHLAGARSSFHFLGTGGGSTASGVIPDNRTIGSLSGAWRNLQAWNEAGQDILVEGCSSFRAIWMRGHYRLLDTFALPPSMTIATGFEQVDCYWLLSESRLPTEQWENLRKQTHEAFLNLGADGHTHLSGVVALPGTIRHRDGRSQLIEHSNPYGEPTAYRLQQLVEAFGVTVPSSRTAPPVIEMGEAASQTPTEIPPARGKVASAIRALDQRLAEGVKEQDKGGEVAAPISISDLMRDVGMKDRKNFKKDVLRHSAFVAAMEDRGLEYVAGQWRGKAGYLARKGGEPHP